MKLPITDEQFCLAKDRISDSDFLGRYQTDLQKKAKNAIRFFRKVLFWKFTDDEFLFILAKVLAPMMICLDLEVEEIEHFDPSRVLVPSKIVDRFYHEHLLPNLELMAMLNAFMYNLMGNFKDNNKDWELAKDEIFIQIYKMVYILHSLATMKG